MGASGALACQPADAMTDRQTGRVPGAHPLLIIALSGCLLSLAAGYFDVRSRHADEVRHVVSNLSVARASLERVIGELIGASSALAQLVTVDGTPSEARFAQLAGLAMDASPMIQSLSLAPGDVVAMSYPLAGNAAAIGLDLRSRPEQYRDVVQARESGKPVLNGPVRLLQGGHSFILRVPVWRIAADADTAGQAYWGLVSVLARADAVLEGMRAATADLDVVLLRTDADGLERVLDGDATVLDGRPVTVSVLAPGVALQLSGVPKGGWNPEQLLISRAFWFGIVLTVLTLWLSEQRTRQLRRMQAVIDERDAEMRSREHEERRFRMLFESSPDPVWIIEGNRFVRCNQAAADVVGLASRDEAISLHPSQLSPPVQPDGEPSLDKAERMMAKARANGVHRFEWTHLRADGSPFLAEVTLIMTLMGDDPVIYTVWRDITVQRNDERQLRLAAAALEATGEAVLITDADISIVSVNPAFTAITGYAADEVIGRSPRLLRSGHHDSAFYRILWQTLLETGTWQGELWNRRRNGELFPVWSVITAIRGERGELTNYVSVFSDISSIKQSQQQLQQMAHYDPLTALPNRVLMHDRLQYAFVHARRDGRRVVLLILDLDGFKAVNDVYGHPAGDALLTQVAERLSGCLRAGDTVARLGGDEFAVILPDALRGSDALGVIGKILEAIDAPFSLDAISANIGVSIGAAVFPEDGDSVTALIKNADAAMYAAKEAGRHTYRFYQRIMTDEVEQRLQLERALRSAVGTPALEVWYQPQQLLSDDRVIGMEALLRWRDPVLGLVSPMHFIPVAEQSGMIIAIGEQVIDTVCRQLAEWRQADLFAGHVAINIATPQIESEDFVTRLRLAQEQSGLHAGCIEIELTESTLMTRADVVRASLTLLRDLGFKAAIDDFGTGYSSLAYLKDLPLDTIKIDRAFIKDLPGDVHAAAIVRAIIAMAHSLGCGVIAEGVETEAQRDWLADNDCDEIQGYLLARPMPHDAVADWLRARR